MRPFVESAILGVAPQEPSIGGSWSGVPPDSVAADAWRTGGSSRVSPTDPPAGSRSAARSLWHRAGATLEQVKAARPTADYDTRYGALTGPWTTEMFVEAIFKTLRK